MTCLMQNKLIIALAYYFILYEKIIIVQCCTKPSFNNIKLEVTLENGHSKNITVDKCISPYKNYVENAQVGWVSKIYVSEQLIPILHREAIANFAHLRKIDLPKNQISTISSSAFLDLSILKTVTLSDNKIEFLENGIFENTPELKYVNLDKNHLTNFEAQWLGNTPKLSFLNLTYNYFEKIPSATFSDLKQLNYLGLAHNLISEIGPGAFSGVDNLKILDLSYNQIKTFEKYVFNPLLNLRVLNLFSNQFNYVPDQVLKQWSKMEVVITRMNPVSCWCLLKILNQTNSACTNINLQREIFKCRSVEDIENIPVCVVTSGEACRVDETEDLLSILTLKQPKYDCYLNAEGLVYHILFDP